VDLGSGGGGAGIIPIFLAQTIDFLQAEIAYATGDIPGARAFLSDGVTKSI